jgi:hydrogenase nickel incorporation protein HypA/HybF
MHEYSIVVALLQQVTEQARRRGARHVTRVRVRLGELAGVDPDLLDTAFGTFCHTDALYAATKLEIASVPRVWACSGCGLPFEDGARLWCPACDLPARLVSGDEILLDQIEMEIDDVQ